MSKKTCPKCNKNTLTELIIPESVNIKGEEILLEIPVLRCNECGEEFYNFDEDNDVLDLAYREYRSKYNMVQPEKIKEFRKEFGLTQQELAKLLGWGGATISRYENGALQDEAHDKVLHLTMEPENLKKLILDNPNALSAEKQSSILEKIATGSQEEIKDIKNYFIEQFGNYPPDEFSGYLRLNIEKIDNSILFLCSGSGELKTKLNKLLFYADFLHYKEYGASITGARYIHLPYGPVLDNYEFYFASLIHEDGSIQVIEKKFRDYIGEVLTSNNQPDIGVFSPSELRILAKVKEHFQEYSATSISEKAHQEIGYLETDELDPISYKYADEMDL